MRLTLPLTGTVLVEGSLADGLLVGDPRDPIRPVEIDLGNVSWTAVDVDLKNEVMVIEVEAAETVDEPTGLVDAWGNPVWKMRKATDVEKEAYLKYARELVMEHMKDELYAMSGCPRLKRPKKKGEG